MNVKSACFFFFPARARKKKERKTCTSFGRDHPGGTSVLIKKGLCTHEHKGVRTSRPPGVLHEWTTCLNWCMHTLFVKCTSALFCILPVQCVNQYCLTCWRTLVNNVVNWMEWQSRSCIILNHCSCANGGPNWEWQLSMAFKSTFKLVRPSSILHSAVDPGGLTFGRAWDTFYWVHLSVHCVFGISTIFVSNPYSSWLPLKFLSICKCTFTFISFSFCAHIQTGLHRRYQMCIVKDLFIIHTSVYESSKSDKQSSWNPSRDAPSADICPSWTDMPFVAW